MWLLVRTNNGVSGLLVPASDALGTYFYPSDRVFRYRRFFDEVIERGTIDCVTLSQAKEYIQSSLRRMDEVVLIDSTSDEPDCGVYVGNISRDGLHLRANQTIYEVVSSIRD